MRIYLAVGLFFGATFIAVGQEVYTLNQCISIAWQNNLQVKQAELSLEASESELRSAKANALPNLNGFATHNYNWGQRIDPFTNQFANTRVLSNSFGLSAGVDLFNGLQNHQNIKAREAGMSAATYDLEAQKNDIALSVSAAYLQVLMIDELIGSAEQQVTISTQQLERIRIMVEAGATNVGIQYDLEAQLSRDKSLLTQRQNEQRIAMLQLKQMMLLPATAEFLLEKPAVDASSDVQLENTETVYGYAVESMPEIKRAEFSLHQWESQLGMAKSGYYPSLTLSGSVGTGYSGLRTEIQSLNFVGNESIGFTESGENVFTPVFDPNLVKVPFTTQLSDNFNQFVGLSLNVPVFNRYNVRNAVKQAEINRSIAELQLEQEQLGLRQRIESAKADAEAARALYVASRDAVRSSEKAFEFAEARFEAGAINVTEFNTTKNNLLIAEAERSRALYDFVFKSKVLDFYMGRPLGFSSE